MTADVRLAWPCELREYWHSMVPLSQLTRLLMSYGTMVVISIGLLLNILSFRVLSMPRLLKHSSNLYLLALSVYDSCVLIFNFMIGVLRGQNPETINRTFQLLEWLCITHSVGVELFSLLSIWMIVCLTLERLIVVFWPLKASRYCSVKRTRIIILVTSLIILAVSCHKILVSGFEGDSVFGYKACHTHREIVSHAVFFYVAFNTWLPIVLIIVVNVLITWKIQRSGVIRQSLSATRLSSNQSLGSTTAKNMRSVSTKDMKFTRTMKAVSITYLALVLPLGIMQSFELYWNYVQESPASSDADEKRDYIYYQKGKLLLKHIRTLAFFLYQWNFAVNFFIYFVRNHKFRVALQKILPCLPIPESLKKNSLKYQVSSNSTSVTTMSTRDM